MSTRRKTSPAPILRNDSSRPLAPQAATPRTTYGAILAKARAAGIFALCTLAPLGALAGSVSACGAAAPVQPNPYNQPAATGTMAPTDPNAVTAPPTGAGTTPAPLSTSIAPPGSAPTTTPQ